MFHLREHQFYLWRRKTIAWDYKLTIESWIKWLWRIYISFCLVLMIYLINFSVFPYFLKSIFVMGIINWRSRNEDVPTFRSWYDHYEVLVMPFRLTDTPTNFIDLMNKVFRYYLDNFIIIFIDVIWIYSKSGEEYGQHLSVP